MAGSPRRATAWATSARRVRAGRAGLGASPLRCDWKRHLRQPPFVVDAIDEGPSAALTDRDHGIVCPSEATHFLATRTLSAPKVETVNIPLPDRRELDVAGMKLPVMRKDDPASLANDPEALKRARTSADVETLPVAIPRRVRAVLANLRGALGQDVARAREKLCARRWARSSSRPKARRSTRSLKTPPSDWLSRSAVRRWAGLRGPANEPILSRCGWSSYVNSPALDRRQLRGAVGRGRLA